MSAWWTDKKIDSTVTREYINKKLPASRQKDLHQPVAFGDLSDDTYLDWILDHSRRLFLVFDDVGRSDLIFDAVDKSYDDDDLPLSERAILKITQVHGKSNLAERILHRQYKYLFKELGEGSHVDYDVGEVVPVEAMSKLPGLLPNQNTDKVRLGNTVCHRRKISIDEGAIVDRVSLVLTVKALQKLSHTHLVSVFASYTQGGYGHVLSSPVFEVSLKSFLEEPPKSFKILEKPQKRRHLLQWIHCLADAIAYLHDQGYAHQAIRPSNIFIDSNNRICLGESAALDALEDRELPYKKERYEYSSPEQWQRKPVMQEIARSRTVAHGGGRTQRRIPKTNTRSNIRSPTPTPTITSFSYRSGSINRTSLGTSPPPSTLTSRNSLQSRAAESGFPSSPPQSNSSDSNSFLSGPHSSAVSRSSYVSRGTQTVISGEILSSTSSFPAVSSNMSTAPTTLSSSSNKSTSPRRTRITTLAPVPLIDLFPSDIFSISAIFVHLLSSLLSLTSNFHSSSNYSTKSLRTHVSKHNRNAGRGNAPADSSFHANLPYVHSWIDKLEKDASKRTEEEYKCVANVCDVVKAGLQKGMAERWEARDGEMSIRKFVGRFGKCCGEGRLPTTPNEEGSEPEEEVYGDDESSVIILDTPSERSYSRFFDTDSVFSDATEIYSPDTWPLPPQSSVLLGVDPMETSSSTHSPSSQYAARAPTQQARNETPTFQAPSHTANFPNTLQGSEWMRPLLGAQLERITPDYSHINPATSELRPLKNDEILAEFFGHR
ncbi:MAG: hypothetical protein MMC33_009294 [Icmadophila ericetorum]|nr:hypothetical protein [Icmadophila ericetorum]